MRLVNESQRLTSRGSVSEVNSPHIFRRGREQQGKAGEIQTGLEFESVSKRQKEGIIKDLTALKVRRLPSQDQE
jgi:hypothetical protein